MVAKSPVRKFLSTAEAAHEMNVPAATLRSWRKLGVGPEWFRWEGIVRYDAADVSAYIERGRKVPSVRAFLEDKNVSTQGR